MNLEGIYTDHEDYLYHITDHFLPLCDWDLSVYYLLIAVVRLNVVPNGVVMQVMRVFDLVKHEAIVERELVNQSKTHISFIYLFFVQH
jgi:hypothetical protein